MENLANPSVLWVQALPLLLVALFWLLCFVLGTRAWRRYYSGSTVLVTNGKAVGSPNQLYKRAAVLLLILGAAGGFLPSLFMLAKTGQVWSVNHQAPHSMVDRYLLVHIPLAFLWALLVGVQLWTVRCRDVDNCIYAWVG